MDKLEPIRRVFRSAGLYHHAADDLLCGELADAAAPPAALADAMRVVTDAMRSDPEYAWSWHCNVAMAFVDEGGDRAMANHAAARFMRLLANVDPAHELPAMQAQQPAAAVPEGYAAAIKAVQEMMPPRDFRPSAQVWLTGNQVNELHARLDAAAMLAAAERKGDTP